MDRITEVSTVSENLEQDRLFDNLMKVIFIILIFQILDFVLTLKMVVLESVAEELNPIGTLFLSSLNKIHILYSIKMLFPLCMATMTYLMHKTNTLLENRRVVIVVLYMLFVFYGAIVTMNLIQFLWWRLQWL